MGEEDFEFRNATIRKRRLGGETLMSIAKDYGITRERIRQICLYIPCINIIRGAIDKRIKARIKEERKAFDVVSSFHANYKKGDDDECWIWTKSKNPVTGYGHHVAGNKTVFAGVGNSAHRRAWYLATGNIPPVGMSSCIMHTCDNKLCVNPAHLILGTPKMNHDDAVAKGKKEFGRRFKKLSYDEVKEIRKEYKRASDCHALAKKYNVSTSLIYRIAMRYARKDRGRKLTNYQAKAIRYMYSTGKWTLRELGNHYGVGFGTISQITTGKTYKDV